MIKRTNTNYYYKNKFNVNGNGRITPLVSIFFKYTTPEAIQRDLENANGDGTKAIFNIIENNYMAIKKTVSFIWKCWTFQTEENYNPRLIIEIDDCVNIAVECLITNLAPKIRTDASPGEIVTIICYWIEQKVKRAILNEKKLSEGLEIKKIKTFKNSIDDEDMDIENTNDDNIYDENTDELTQDQENDIYYKIYRRYIPLQNSLQKEDQDIINITEKMITKKHNYTKAKEEQNIIFLLEKENQTYQEKLKKPKLEQYYNYKRTKTLSLIKQLMQHKT